MRCEDIWPYFSEMETFKGAEKMFKHFLRGLFGLKDENVKIGSDESLAYAIDSHNWRAIEFLLGQNGTFKDATFPQPHNEESSFDWNRG